MWLGAIPGGGGEGTLLIFGAAAPPVQEQAWPDELGILIGCCCGVKPIEARLWRIRGRAPTGSSVDGRAWVLSSAHVKILCLIWQPICREYQTYACATQRQPTSLAERDILYGPWLIGTPMIEMGSGWKLRSVVTKLVSRGLHRKTAHAVSWFID